MRGLEESKRGVAHDATDWQIPSSRKPPEMMFPSYIHVYREFAESQDQKKSLLPFEAQQRNCPICRKSRVKRPRVSLSRGFERKCTLNMKTVRRRQVSRSSTEKDFYPRLTTTQKLQQPCYWQCSNLPLVIRLRRVLDSNQLTLHAAYRYRLSCKHLCSINFLRIGESRCHTSFRGNQHFHNTQKWRS